MPRLNAWGSGGHPRGHIRHLDLSRTVWAVSATCMPEAGRLRPDHVIPGVEGLDKALEIQQHRTLGADVTPAPRGVSCIAL